MKVINFVYIQVQLKLPHQLEFFFLSVLPFYSLFSIMFEAHEYKNDLLKIAIEIYILVKFSIKIYFNKKIQHFKIKNLKI